ncbi:YchJ family protein [Aureispira anguillae]|uniref:YchJ family protein n=1 Tax=Aureispira anguillae TaxID=2864201 RepID=A0A916DTD6_9BACT|nr:YchJ family protein [Aureispira anguillae]BDS11697.1 YchJ family protein [Aureispira anguillae]
MEKCPCSSKKNYMDCCGAFIEGLAQAPTAEALMRSRYTAHVKLAIDYIMDTVHPINREKSNRKTIESWAEQANWMRLEIVQTTKGKEEDEIGTVLFKAHYKYGNQLKTHFEDSFFRKENGRWYFVEGKEPAANQSTSIKIGRNDPCHCGSGKKFKKCCQKNK